jgi:adenine-specific DNA-methyltransferase
VARIHELLRHLSNTNPDLATEIEREYDAVADRRAFGLNFERHTPEEVELPGRPVRRGDKVHVLPPRGETPKKENHEMWMVESIDKSGDAPVATIVRESGKEELETQEIPLEDLVVVAEFRDPIYPGLVSTGKVERGGNKPYHSVINGENFHALAALLFTHRGKVDAIYIDPPYNTGARDWKYNNDYVEKDDLYRHSKWLAFMERRLKLAKMLLNSEDSVLIIAIDENEVHRIKLLLEQVYDGFKIQMISILVNPAGASIIDQFSRVDEHLLFVHIGGARPQRTVIDTTPGYSTFVSVNGKPKPFTWEPFQRSGGNSRRQDTKAKFFPVFINPEAGTVIGCGDQVPEEMDRENAPLGPAGCVTLWPIKQDGSEACWQLSAPTFREYLTAGRVKTTPPRGSSRKWGLSFLTKGHMAAIDRGELEVLGRDETGALVVKNAEGRVRSQIGKTLWTNGAYSATEHGSSFLNKVIPGRKFPFPKSLYAVEDTLRHYVLNKPEAIILDFFAGSGTTAHAVMRLNKQDGGNRVCISVTNNEVSAEEQKELRNQGLRAGDVDWEQWGICDYITKPRIASAITGMTPDGNPIAGDYKFTDEFPMADGFNENVEFFTLTYEPSLQVSANRSFDRIAPLMWLRAGSTGRRIEAVPDGWDVTETYGVLIDMAAADSFVTAIVENQKVAHAFIFTGEDRLFETVSQQLPARVEPVRMYESYLRNFEQDALRVTR